MIARRVTPIQQRNEAVSRRFRRRSSPDEHLPEIALRLSRIIRAGVPLESSIVQVDQDMFHRHRSLGIAASHLSVGRPLADVSWDWAANTRSDAERLLVGVIEMGVGAGSDLAQALDAVGEAIRKLPVEVPAELNLPSGFSDPQVCIPGVLAVRSPAFARESDEARTDPQLRRFCESFSPNDSINAFPLVLLVDDSPFVAAKLNNFLWATFTRSNPATDIDGIAAWTEHRHWGCDGSLVIDARVKPFHAPPLIEDPEVSKRVDAMAARGGVLTKWL